MWGEKVKVRDFLLIANQDLCLSKDLKEKREREPTYRSLTLHLMPAQMVLEGKKKCFREGNAWEMKCLSSNTPNLENLKIEKKISAGRFFLC